MSLLFVPSLGFKHFLQLSCFQKQRSFSLGPCKYSLYQVKPIIWKVNRSVACVDVPLKKASERQTGVADTLYHNAEALETKIVIDNEKDFYHSIISVRCKDRPGLLKDLTYCLETAGITVERALVKTESQLALDTFFVTDSGSKIAEEDFEKIEHIITQTLESKKGANTTINWVPLAGKKVYVQNRNKYVDHERGIAVVTDNSSSPLYTTVTLTAPNIPGIVSQFLANLAYLELNVSFASLACVSSQGNTRQDVFHVTSMEGKQLDEATCNEIVNMAYFMLSTPQVEEDSY
ncbi:protein-P-II uridylyltransferase-like protein [Galdieria sulphuraria]|uniref:Protein-P-II uridylyltransferase-like protein n=1 Tax=Galdieria sulphuraria TaxID=130081 RepID=M2VUQ0_GALSU|nr:protein-P-II uridylyltransferase-like protein [Galdieria sulphuraria]EME26906.1 protein-P-II uridylyltransferase-like protein [Galdieria sulphuraria]|eukprot:XP_005703426.1 protein-P-II uridylyltransferase-like protein [Galdieria sulphuraria]